MISIEYNNGRLGNRILKYALARILSEKFNQKIITNPPYFPFKKSDTGSEIIYDETIILDDENFLEILNLKNIEKNLHLKGFFQNKSFILNYKNEIKNILDIPSETKNGIFIHYRLGDNISKPKRVVNNNYYYYCLYEILKKSNEKIFVSTDSPNSTLIKDLIIKCGAELINKRPQNTIIYGSQFENKILSLGTFSWWIGFLGNQNNVYCPNINDYKIWHGDIFLESWKTINREKYKSNKK
jgi:hypothetical protein